MPTYEYRCNGCRREFEYVQKMSDDDLVKCEACGEDKLEKLISRTAFQLKGSGWYKDLYSSAKPGDSASSTTPSTDTPAAKADAPAASSSTSSDSSSSSTTTPAAAAPSTPSKPPSSAT